MEAGKHTIKQLFQRDIRYIIPTFQRPYVWNQEKQWDPLWEDVRNLAERYLEQLERNEDSQALAEAATGTHFLGAVVLQQIPTTTAEIEQRHVIDGQQRMTTLQILLDAAQEVLEVGDHARPAKRLRRLVLNDDDFAEGDEQFKLWPTTSDRDAFRAAMANGQDASAHGDSLIVKAHKYFCEQIQHWLGTDDCSRQRADALFTALSGLLELVVIDLKTEDDAYIIFETLNARGTPLLASDLVKNFVLQTAASDGMDSERIHDTYWRPLEAGWWREDIRQGRIVRPRIDVFLNYWLAARMREEVSSQQVFPMFRRHVADSAAGIDEIVRDIQHVGHTYHRLYESPSTSLEGTFLYRWDVVQAGVVTPLLLDLFSAPSSVLPVERRNRCLMAVESFLVRRMACRMTTKDYNRLFMELLSRLDGQVARADEVVVEYLAAQTADSRVWPTDDMFRASLRELPLYRLLTRARLRMLLEALEEALRTEKAEDPNVVRTKLTIEHILPQKWQTHWSLDVGEDPEAYLRRVSRRDRLKHTIGNLTLLTAKLNPSLSNGPWAKKRRGIDDHSTLFLNKAILAQCTDDRWDESQILRRSDRLANLATRVWAGPADLEATTR